MWDTGELNRGTGQEVAAGWVQSRVQAVASSCSSEVPLPFKAATVNTPLAFLTSWSESCGLMSSCLGTGFVSCCVLRSTSIQTCLFASDQTCPAWDWIQVSYSSTFSFGSRRATFALNCNLAVHGSEVLLSPLLCTENALQGVRESPGYQAKLKAPGIFTYLCVPRPQWRSRNSILWYDLNSQSTPSSHPIPAWLLPSPFSSCFSSSNGSEWVHRHDWVTRVRNTRCSHLEKSSMCRMVFLGNETAVW